MDELGRVLVVGTGLIGTSIALALRERDVEVRLADRDPSSVRFSEELGAGSRLSEDAPEGPADLAVLAVPPHAVAPTLLWAQRGGLAAAYTDVASVKRAPLAEAARIGCDLASFTGGHPLAGRERAGPAAARADLFLGRPWVLCPSPHTEEKALQAADSLARSCGAEPSRMQPECHDRAAAVVSHAPHLVASAVAARLLDADPVALRLAGQGLRDTTRVAAGEPELWRGILAANAGPVAETLDEVASELAAAATTLRAIADGSDGDGLVRLLERGRDGRAKVPGKRGGTAPAYAVVQVVIQDRPGELARLFDAAGEAEVNIEDVALEHSPGLPVGVAELSVRPHSVEVLVDRLRASGWSVQG